MPTTGSASHIHHSFYVVGIIISPVYSEENPWQEREIICPQSPIAKKEKKKLRSNAKAHILGLSPSNCKFSNLQKSARIHLYVLHLDSNINISLHFLPQPSPPHMYAFIRTIWKFQRWCHFTLESFSVVSYPKSKNILHNHQMSNTLRKLHSDTVLFPNVQSTIRFPLLSQIMSFIAIFQWIRQRRMKGREGDRNRKESGMNLT